MVATFVTIPASNYVEKARWALQLAGIPFTEHKYAPLLAYVSTRPNGGKSVPLLVLPGSGDAKDASKPRVLTDSSEILDYCATKLPELYPTLKTKELELLYDKALGPHTRRCAYHILFADSAAGRQIIAGPLGFFQYYVTYLLYPMLKALLKRGLNVNTKAAERSWEKIELMLKEVEERLGDGPVGTQFLDGNKFSAADITLCAHLSLLLFPPQHSYIGRQVSVERIKDPVFKQRIEKLQRSKVGNLPPVFVRAFASTIEAHLMSVAAIPVFPSHSNAHHHPSVLGMTVRLISISASNYVKGRWALHFANMPFVEDEFLAVVHAFNTRLKGGDMVPLLYFPASKKVLTDSSDILDFCVQELPSLYPTEGSKALELYYDKELGSSTSQFTDFALLWLHTQPISLSPQRSHRRSECSSGPSKAGHLLFPLLRYILLSRLHVTEGGAAKSVECVGRMVQETDKKLGNALIGTRFIAGDPFSAADVAFCAHMLLIIIPLEHAHIGFVTLANFDYPLRVHIEELQRAKSGEFVDWCYKHKQPAIP